MKCCSFCHYAFEVITRSVDLQLISGSLFALVKGCMSVVCGKVERQTRIRYSSCEVSREGFQFDSSGRK